MSFFDKLQGNNNQNNVQQPAPSQQQAPVQKSFYQQNLAKPVQQNTNWFKGTMPTTTEMYGRIAYIGQHDPNAARQIATGFAQAQQTVGSPWYNPYLKATNQAVDTLKSYGVNPADLTDEWFQQNTEWQKHLRYGATTNTPLSPLKNATDQQKLSFAIYQYWFSMDETKKAQEEAKALREEVAYKANDPNHNWSDDEIKNSIDWEKKYSTLGKARAEAAAGRAMEFNDAIAFSDDDMNGWIWAARNNGGTGDGRADMANYANGEGNVWKDNPELAAKWDKKNGDTYSPFQAGMTLDPEVGLYFNQYSFTRDDIERLWNGIDENDKTAVDMIQKAEKAVENTEKANEDLAKLNKRIASLVNGSSKRDPQTIKDMIIKELQDGKKYPTLSKMYENINKPWSDIVETGSAVNFSTNSLFDSIDRQCEERDSKTNGGQFQNELTQSENGAPVLSGDVDAVSGADYQAPKAKEPEKTENPEKQEEAAAPVETYTPADIATGQEKDKARNDAAASVEDDMTDEEKTVFANTGSSFFDRTREMLTEKVKTVTENLDKFNKAITQGASAVCTQKYFETALETSYDIALYKDTQAALDEDEAQLAVYQQKYGDIKYFQDASTFKPEVEEQIGDFDVFLRFDENQDKYVVEDIYSVKRGIDYQMLLSYIGQGLDWVEDTIQQADAIAEKLTPEAQKSRAALANAEKYGEEGQQEIKAYKALYAKAERERQYLSENEQAYKDGDTLMTQMTNDLEMMIDAQHMLGLDTTYIEETLAYIDHLSNYYDEPKLPGREDDYLQGYLKLNPTATPEESRKYLDELAAKAQKEIDYIELDEDFLTGSGYKVPDKIKRNLQYRKEDLQNILKSIEYSKVKMDTDPKEFSAAVEAGKAFEKKALDNAHDINLTGLANNVGSNYYGFEDLATEDEKELYYYYLGKSAMAGEEEYDRLTEEFRNSRNVADREAAKEALDKILKDGADYLDFLGNDDYGVWKVRDANKIAEKAKADVNAGTGSGVVANIESTLLTPLESIESAIYLLDRAIGGKRINPNTGARGFSIYKENVRSATFQSIKDVYGEGTFAEKLASLGYEIYSNRGDSLMNSMVFGPIFGFSGKFGDILNSFAGSTPMGATAALNAAAHAVEQGASVDQAWLIGGITFLSETLTEAITFSNIKEAFGTTKGLTKDTLKDFFREWITKNGLEEAMGESLNDILENAGEEWAQAFEKDPNAYLSGRQQLIDKYIGEGYTEDEALERAVAEEINGVLHTAFVSYLSAGSDVAIKTVTAGLNTVKYGAEVTNAYRKYTKMRQKEGHSESMMDYMLQRKKKTMKGYFTDEASTSTAMDNAIAGEQAVNEQLSGNTMQNTDKSNARVNLNEQKQAASMQDVDTEAVNEQKKQDLKNKQANKVKKGSAEEQQAAAAVVTMQRAKTADAATQAAAASAFLDEGTGPAPDYEAAAGAAYVSEIFGEDGASMIQQTVMGAAKSKISLSIVKQSIKNALLGNGAATQIAKSEAFRNASPEEKARMITSVFGQDMRDQEVQNSIFAKCKDYRRTQEMTNLMDEGFFEEVQTARENANKAAADEYAANEELNAQRNVEQQAADNLTEMTRIATEDPSHNNMERQHKAIEDHKSQAIVTDQREEAARKTADKRKAADEKANEVSKKKMKEAREIADQKIAEQDINLAQQQEQQRIEQEQQAQAQAEEQARLQAEEDERTGKADEDRQNAAIDQTVEQQNLSPEETAKKKEEAKKLLSKVKETVTDLTQPVSNVEGLKAVRAFGRKLGLNIEFVDLPYSKDLLVRGGYSNGTVYLNQNMIKQGKLTVGQALVEAAVHEVTHAMQNTGAYQTYRKVVLDTMMDIKSAGDAMTLYRNDPKYKAYIDHIIEQRKKANDSNFSEGKSLESMVLAADQEVVADFARLNLANKDTVQRFMDAGLGGKMRNILHNINQALKNFFKNMTGDERKVAEQLRKAERAFQKAMDQVAKEAVHPDSEQFSVQQIAQATNLGMVCTDDTLQLLLPSEDGDIIGDGNNGTVKGQRYVEIDGVTEGRKITPEMIRSTPVGMLIDMGLSDVEFDGNDGEKHTQRGDARKMFADLMNLCARYKDNNLIWEIAGSEFSEGFSALKSNSDPQYKTTVDFGTICAKTQGIIDTLSGTMLERIKVFKERNAKAKEAWYQEHGTYEGFKPEVFTGLTRDDIMMVYNKTHNAGLSVPCPVCYVFSRWMGVPSLLGQMNRFQNEYVVTVKDAKGDTVYGENGDAVIDWAATKQKANEYLKQMVKDYSGVELTADMTEEERIKTIDTAKEKIAKEKQSIQNKIRTRQKNLPKLNEKLKTLQDSIGKPTNKRIMELELKLANPDLTDKQRARTEKSLENAKAKQEQKTLEQIEKTKTDIETNLRETDQFQDDIKEYEAFNWVSQALCLQHRDGQKTLNDLDENGDFVVDEEHFRLTPEEILFDMNRTGEFAGYTKNWSYRTTRGAGMGKAIMPYSGASIGDIINGKAIRWQQGQNPFLNMDEDAAKKAFDAAKERVRRQNLVGGQRFQSTSDFRPEWGLDYIMSFLEMQALGSKVQMYTKVAEAVDFLGSIGVDANLSIMGKGNGWHIASDEEIALSQKDTDEGRELKSRMGVTTDEDGIEHTFVMDFSDVTGMDYNTAKGKTKLFNSVQMILVGMNDIHIKLAMANDDIDFIIPWHSSGNSKDVLQQLVSTFKGESLTESSDYTDFQTDHIKSHKEGTGSSEKTIDDRTADEIQRWEWRMKILTGVANNDQSGDDASKHGLTLEERKAVYEDEWLGPLYHRFYDKNEDGTWADPDCGGVALTKDQAEQIFPYEYWDKSTTRENADVNGDRFSKYCDWLGMVPRFSQFKGEHGYWKLLIDRKMYENNEMNEDGTVKTYGKYRNQNVVDVTKAAMNVDPNSTLDPATKRKADVYQLPESTTAKYRTKDSFSAETDAAIMAASEALSEKYDVQGSYDAYADQGDIQMSASVQDGLTAADRDMIQGYDEAIDRGDIDAAQAYVDEAAYRAGYRVRGEHGTTSKFFTIFDREHGNIEGDWGKGFYFSSNSDDVTANYANGEGPDLQVKIERLADKLGGWNEDALDWIDDDVDPQADYQRRLEQARQMLTGGEPRVIHAALKIDNPVVFGGQGETFFDMSMSDDGEPSGKLVDFVEVLTDVLSEYEWARVDTSRILEEGIDYEGLSATDLEALAKEVCGDVTDEEGNYAGNEIVREAFERMGFDGIVDHNVSNKFGNRSGRLNGGMEGVNEETTHYIVFRPEQIKQTDPVTYDDQGNPIPLEQRFNMDNPDIRWSAEGDLTAADRDLLDTDYMAAVERGEMDEAQRMVDEAADEAGYTIPGYHGTSKRFTEFDKSKAGSNWYGDSRYGPGFYFAYDKDTALKWTDGTNVVEARLSMKKPLDLRESVPDDIAEEIKRYYREDKQYDPSFPISYEGYQENLKRLEQMDLENPAYYLSHLKYDKNGKMTDGIREFLSSLGYDGIITDSEMVVFDPEQIKSSAPVTYDDQGRVIPLSERFDTGKKDIRYSSQGTMTEADQDILQTLIDSGTLSEEESEQYRSKFGPTERPLEGQHPAMSTSEGPAVRAFADLDGMLRDSDEVDQFAKAVTLAQNTYFPDTNYEQVQRAVNWIRSIKQTPNSDGYAEALQAVTADNFDYRSADGQARMVAVMGLARAKGDTMAQAALADAFMRQGTDLGRALQARKLFKLMTPEGRMSTLMKMLQNQQDELDKKGKHVDLKFSDWIYKMASVAEDEADFFKVQQAAAAELAEQLPANWKDRIQSIRMLSMLGNPRTHIRNVIGNALFVPAVGMKNKMSALLELGLKKGERTKTMKLILSKDIREFARQDARAIKDTLTGEGKFNEGTLIKQNQAPAGKIIKALSDFNGDWLEREDWFFLRGHYRKALGGWMEANGYTVNQVKSDPKLLEQGRAYAIEEAKKATYRDFSQTAKTLNEVARKGGVTGFLVEAVLPFKKTPINILRRGVEYSPIGIAKSIYTLASQMKRGEVSPTQVIDQFCSGLSGTAIMTMGFLLAGSGAVSCGLDDDEDKFGKAKGNQKYSIRFSLFGQDVTYTMDWAAPMSMPFFVGASIRNMMEEEGEVDINKVIGAMSTISEPVFNLSMLDGINTLFKTNSYNSESPITQIGGKIVSNYVTSYVPSLFGAIARTIDDKQRKTFVEKDKNNGLVGTALYAFEQSQNKIPWANQQNIANRDIWGEEKTSSLVERIVENFISPGYIETYKEDPIINEMARLYDSRATGYNSMLLDEDPDKSISFTNKMTGQKEDHILTAEQWDRVKEVRGKTAKKELTELIASEGYQRATNEEQIKMIDAVWKHADKVGKKAVVPDFPLDDDQDVKTIARDSRLSSQKTQIFKALEDGDYDTYETMVEAVRREYEDESEADEKIRGWIRDKYRDQYKTAYRRGDADGLERMAEIEEFIDYTGFDIDYMGWQAAVDEEND